MREYITISMRPGVPADVIVSVFPGDGLRVRAGVIKDYRPYVMIRQGDVQVDISTDDPPVSAADVAAARKLAEAFAAYLAEVERLHAAESGTGLERAA